MKTERQIVDDLGDWLCTDMEKEIAKSDCEAGLPSTASMAQRALIIDVARRIKWYAENCVSQ